MASVEAIIMYAYLIIMLIIGFVALRYEKAGSEEGFFLASRSLGWVALTFTVAGTYFSTYALLGVAGMLYKAGVPWITVSVSTPLIVAFVTWFVGRRIWFLGKEFGYITPADLLDDYFQSKGLRILTVIVNIGYCIPYVTIQIIGGAKVLQMATDGAIPFTVGAWFILAILLAYVMLGGMRAVAWTDIIQGILLLMGMWIGGFYAGYRLFQNPTELWNRAVTQVPQLLTMPGALGTLTWVGILTQALMIAFGQIPGGAPFWMRCYAARGFRELRTSAVLNAVLLPLPYFFASTLIGIGGRLAYPSLAQPDNVYLQILADYSVPAMAGFVFAAIVAAGMSTADSNLHAISAVLTRDVYKTFIRPHASEKELVWFGRGVILVIGLVSMVISLYWAGMIVPLAFIAMSISTQLLPPLLAVLFWKRASKWGAFFGLLVGLVVVYLTLYPWPNPLNIHGGIWGLMANTLVLVVVSYLTKPQPKEIVERVHGALAKMEEEEQAYHSTAVGTTA